MPGTGWRRPRAGTASPTSGCAKTGPSPRPCGWSPAEPSTPCPGEDRGALWGTALSASCHCGCSCCCSGCWPPSWPMSTASYRAPAMTTPLGGTWRGEMGSARTPVGLQNLPCRPTVALAPSCSWTGMRGSPTAAWAPCWCIYVGPLLSASQLCTALCLSWGGVQFLLHQPLPTPLDSSSLPAPPPRIPPTHLGELPSPPPPKSLPLLVGQGELPDHKGANWPQVLFCWGGGVLSPPSPGATQ